MEIREWVFVPSKKLSSGDLVTHEHCLVVSVVSLPGSFLIFTRKANWKILLPWELSLSSRAVQTEKGTESFVFSIHVGVLE